MSDAEAASPRAESPREAEAQAQAVDAQAEEQQLQPAPVPEPEPEEAPDAELETGQQQTEAPSEEQQEQEEQQSPAEEETPASQPEPQQPAERSPEEQTPEEPQMESEAATDSQAATDADAAPEPDATVEQEQQESLPEDPSQEAQQPAEATQEEAEQEEQEEKEEEEAQAEEQQMPDSAEADVASPSQQQPSETAEVDSQAADAEQQRAELQRQLEEEKQAEDEAREQEAFDEQQRQQQQLHHQQPQQQQQHQQTEAEDDASHDQQHWDDERDAGVQAQHFEDQHDQLDEEQGEGEWSGGKHEEESKEEAAGEESAYRMPDILKVVINREELELEAEEQEEKEMDGYDGPPLERTPEQVVYVQVVRDNLHARKPFLGGFRHKYLGTVYHHASTQTARKKKKAEKVKFHRETQTIHVVSRSQQTNREAGTQMERRDLLLDNSGDKVIVSRPYFTADELEALRDEKAREVQCFLRQCFAWRRVRRLREAKAETVLAQLRAKEEKEAREAAEHAKQIQRRMHPRTKEDFAVLFAELEAWRLHETQRIKDSGLAPEEIAAALQELLHKEVKLLQTIDRLKITAAKENKLSRTQSQLEKMASPKEWSSREGDLIEVETPFTTRAKELVDLYNGLCLRSLSRAQRVDVLLHIKYTVKEFDCELSREIVELIRREEDLLRRQRSEQSLEGLRKRLQNLFLQFVNTPHFNPEAANFQRVPAGSGIAPPPPALSSSLAKPAMLTKNNTIIVSHNVTGRIFATENGGQ